VAEKKLDKSLEPLLQVIENLHVFRARIYPKPSEPSGSLALPEASDFKT
jgi:hypothetical protein